MTKSTLIELIDNIKKEQQPKVITPRDLFNALGYERRTKNNCDAVDCFLNENDMIVEPHYNSVWIDNTIVIKPKDVAHRRKDIEPVKQLQVLEMSTKQPTVVDKNDKLSKAITLMQYYNFSQLPVISSSMRNLVGCISWRSIGMAITNGITTNIVKDYMTNEYHVCDLQTPLLSAIQDVLSYEYVVVTNASKEICGIITTSDISQQYITWTKPFVLLEEIENLIRYLLEGKFLLEEIRKVCQEKDRQVNNLDDLTFGEYIVFLQNEINWNKLKLTSVDKKEFITRLDDVRIIRNDVMHFEPAGLTKEQLESLECMSRYLRTLIKFNNQKL